MQSFGRLCEGSRTTPAYTLGPVWRTHNSNLAENVQLPKLLRLSIHGGSANPGNGSKDVFAPFVGKCETSNLAADIWYRHSKETAAPSADFWDELWCNPNTFRLRQTVQEVFEILHLIDVQSDTPELWGGRMVLCSQRLQLPGHAPPAVAIHSQPNNDHVSTHPNRAASSCDAI